VYRRADLWRTFVLVVALLLTAVSTGALTCEFHGPDVDTGAASLSHIKSALIRTVASPPAGGAQRT
jgi:hypothetical protein